MHESDSFERNVMLDIANRTLQLQRRLNEELAAKIIENLAKAMKK